MAPKGSVRDSLVSQFEGWRRVIQRREARRPRGIWYTERLGHPAMGLSPMGWVGPRWDRPEAVEFSPMGRICPRWDWPGREASSRWPGLRARVGLLAASGISLTCRPGCPSVHADV